MLNWGEFSSLPCSKWYVFFVMKIWTIITIAVIERFEHAMIVGTRHRRSFEFVKSGNQYVYVLLEIRKINRFMSEI